jgi:subtilisin family serine protease
MNLAQLGDANGVVFDTLGVAIVDAEPDAVMALSSGADGAGPILNVEPERIMFATGQLPTAPPEIAETPRDTTLNYIRGFRDAIVGLYGHMSGETAVLEAMEPAEIFTDTDAFTWGLQATRVVASTASGRNIKVAILDTGLDLTHPDFAGRSITSHSFIPGETAQDGHSHGTHTCGTACGTQHPGVGPRYGIAFNSRIFIGKVLSNAGSGPDLSILAGIEWAIRNGCQVVSMSLGLEAPPSFAYETIGTRALSNGTLIVAAAGNDSDRVHGVIKPVERPANSMSIMAVAALDRRLNIAGFSNRGSTTGGGQVDIGGPGVAVLSSVPMPARTNSFNGTSMATPHVSGIAALIAERTGLRGPALWHRLTVTARRLTLSSRDVGAGLVQAP